MAGRVSVSSPDAKQAAKALRQAAARMPKVVRKANVAAEKKAAGWAKGAARTRQQQRMAGGVGVTAGQSLAVTLRNTAGAPGAVPAFRGALRRTGWYADRRYSGSTGRQYPSWVGRDGVSPAGDAVADKVPAVADIHAEAQVAAILRGLPNSR